MSRSNCNISASNRPVCRLREDCARDGHLQSVMIADAV